MRGRIFRTGSIEKNRLEAFSDGVLAIVITLLVLDLKVPEGIRDEAALWRALAHALPAFGAWTVSFLFVLVFWVSHHYFITSLKHADRGLLWLNGLFLLFISSTPFPTGLVGTYPGMTPALVLLSASMFGTAFTFAAMRFYATYHGSLVGDHITPDQQRLGMLQSSIAPALYLVSIASAFVWKPATILIQVLVPLIFFLRSSSRHTAPSLSGDRRRPA